MKVKILKKVAERKGYKVGVVVEVTTEYGNELIERECAEGLHGNSKTTDKKKFKNTKK